MAVAPWSYKAVWISPCHWNCAEAGSAPLQCAKRSRFLEGKIAALQSLLKRSELFKRVHSQTVDMPLHRGFSLFAVSFNQCINNGQVLIVRNAFGNTQSEKLRAVLEVCNYGRKFRISTCLGDHPM